VAKGVLYVETYALPDQIEAYHAWYDEVHLREFVDYIDGVVSARRFAPRNPDHPFITVYELEADDLEAVRERMLAWKGQMSDPIGVDASRPGTTRFYELHSTYP
jgi:hypothetical protein